MFDFVLIFKMFDCSNIFINIYRHKTKKQLLFLVSINNTEKVKIF